MEPALPKWPFFLGDALLVGAASLISLQSKGPLGFWHLCFLVLAIAAGAWLSIMPFLLEYRVTARLAEARALTSLVSQIQNLERLAAQISGATGQWQSVQEQADKTTAMVKQVTERMTAEVQGFTEFMQRVNDSEKSGLRLEVDKLRRGENDWLQVLVRMLDHVFALHQGALRSGQPNLIAQLGNFQNACRDAARRVGLTPFWANPSDPFDAERQQLVDVDGKPGPDAVVAETVAAGFTFQGKLLRPALVRLQNSPSTEMPVALANAREPDAARQGQFPLDQPVSAQG